MEQNSTANRLHALDGIRGLAIILVVLTHVNAQFILPLLHPAVGQMIFGSGVTGVSLLFMLSGFFMTYIYPNPASSMQFLQKRYTRIFPLFLTMCAVMLYLRVLPETPWYLQLAVILGFAVVAHLLWVYGIKKYASVMTKKGIFLAFLFLQVCMAAIYILWIMRQPAIIFNQQIPTVARESIIGLVNGTLTLPFGNYIPMLDGVYWSLASEIYFYILYPVVCVPLIHFFSAQRRSVKIVGIVLLIPFFAALDMLSHKLFVLSMLQLSLCFYFIPGMVLGYLFRHHGEKIQAMNRFFPEIFSYATPLFFLIFIFIKPLILNLGNKTIDSWIHMLYAFPLMFFMALALDQQTKLSKFLNAKALVFLGTISYSVYLSHTAIAHMIEKNYHTHRTIENVLTIAGIFCSTILISSLLYYLLERPYFRRNKQKEIITERTPSRFQQFVAKPSFIFSSVFLVCTLSVFSAYQSNFNLFSVEHPFSSTGFAQDTKGQSSLPLKPSQKVTFTFQPQDDNLAIIAMHLTHITPIHGSDTGQQLVFHIKERNQKEWYATNTYALSEMGDSLEHPFGFPLIQDAKGKTYLIELSLTKPNTLDYLSIDPLSVKGVYQVNKITLLKHPTQLVAFLSNRVSTVVTKPNAKITTLLLLPFLLFSFLLLFTRRKYSV